MLQTSLFALLLLTLPSGVSGSANPESNSQSPPRLTFSRPVPPDTLITLERTMCPGLCPVYKLTIRADGTVQFEGRHVEAGEVSPGEIKKGTISKEGIDSLVSEFEKADYFSFKDSYRIGDKDCRESRTDHPSAITSITINGKSKSVTHDYGCKGNARLDDLTKLESKIDEVADTKQWLHDYYD